MANRLFAQSLRLIFICVCVCVSANKTEGQNAKGISTFSFSVCVTRSSSKLFDTAQLVAAAAAATSP